MVSNQVLGARLAAGLLILSVTVCGCSHLRHTEEIAPAAFSPATAPAIFFSPHFTKLDSRTSGSL